jgi:hypothetical protein
LFEAVLKAKKLFGAILSWYSVKKLYSFSEEGDTEMIKQTITLKRRRAVGIQPAKETELRKKSGG